MGAKGLGNLTSFFSPCTQIKHLLAERFED